MTSTLAPAKSAGTMSGSSTALQIVADLDRPAADAPVGVRLLEMPARVIDDIPVDAVLLDVVGQQGLREISVLKLLVVGQRHDLGARLVDRFAAPSPARCRRRSPPCRPLPECSTPPPSGSCAAPWSCARRDSGHCRDAAPRISSAASISRSRSRPHRGCRWRCCAGAG